MLPIAQQLMVNNSVVLLSAYFLTASSRAARKPPTMAKMIPNIAVVFKVNIRSRGPFRRYAQDAPRPKCNELADVTKCLVYAFQKYR